MSPKVGDTDFSPSPPSSLERHAPQKVGLWRENGFPHFFRGDAGKIALAYKKNGRGNISGGGKNNFFTAPTKIGGKPQSCFFGGEWR